MLYTCAAMEREQSQGGILAGGDFRLLFRRKYNRLPLGEATRITLAAKKEATASFPAAPARGCWGQGDAFPCRFLGQRPKPPEGLRHAAMFVLIFLCCQHISLLRGYLYEFSSYIRRKKLLISLICKQAFAGDYFLIALYQNRSNEPQQ